MNVDVLEEIANNSSRLVKEALLPRLDEDLRMFVRIALDQNVTFGVTIDEDEAIAVQKDFQPEEIFAKELHDFLEACSTRTLSGGSAQQEMARVIQMASSALHAKWAARIINRNLRAGFDIKTYNRVFGEDGDEVAKFPVQLAETWSGEDGLAGEWLVEPKLNGNRVVVFKRQATSRGNRVYTAADHVVAELKELGDFLDRYVPDGEMMGNLGFDKSSGALRRQNKKNVKAEFTYWVFDLFTTEEYGGETATLRERKERLQKLFAEHGFQFIKMVPWKVLKNPSRTEILAAIREFVEAGFEGAMLKRLDSRAKFDRSDDLLKAKLFYEDEFTITSVYEGRGRHKGSLGGVIVEGTIKWGHLGQPQLERKVKSKCGSGWTDILREMVWKNPEQWIGATVQVQFQEVTAKGSLQFPVFVTRRWDKEPRWTKGEPTGADKPRIRERTSQRGMFSPTRTKEEIDAEFTDLDKEYE